MKREGGEIPPRTRRCNGQNSVRSLKGEKFPGISCPHESREIAAPPHGMASNLREDRTQIAPSQKTCLPPVVCPREMGLQAELLRFARSNSLSEPQGHVASHGILRFTRHAAFRSPRTTTCP